MLNKACKPIFKPLLYFNVMSSICYDVRGLYFRFWRYNF